ncbi:class I SAM-dependent methyltransferase [Sulfurovum sp.]|jgi:ubiquinone/menaquinone biosynthesis C-methylase UbiE|uniref:class I SAM-dependent methyltransferase n=1 Tax=Sulfurovum sp. TaxID=1969726 RepID=UPI002A35B065|nr:class I SAM-dependent methyltransferase [Sulfurovum sp.]MDD2450825.1 class I SAM-dependent methyltransferase [Sulfurovum sp.]MDD3498780.1 class I SAM-dependent methyltransferase [Sulfurovum sp.]MDY0402059.1 class I SAM-dependent methyltransferase [Sulfurovum sp.]
MQGKKRYPGAGDPQGYDRIVREVFAPIYPVIAGQIVVRTGKQEGHCLDVGCGTGALGRAIAGLSTLHITFFDHSPEMIALSRDYAEEEELIGRSDFLVGDISRLALDDATMDLVVSRGSVPFWNDWERAYREIVRVLKEGGHAYIGGGFGSAALRDEIVQTMNERNKEWRRPFQDKVRLYQEALPAILEALPAAQSNIIDDESGFWVHIIK